jgi:hypothetical protein
MSETFLQFSTWVSGFAVSIILLVSISNYLGIFSARNKEDFFIVTQYPGFPESLAVIQIHGDYFVTMPLIRSSKEVEKKIYFLKTSEIGTSPLTFEKVGPLKLKE